MNMFLTILLCVSIFLAIWMGTVIIGNMVLKSNVPAGTIMLFALGLTYILIYIFVLPH